MNTETIENTAKELTVVQRAAVALGTAEHEFRLREMVKQSASIIEVKNGAGRDECHAAYMRLKNSRISVEKAGKSATEDAKAFTKAVTTEERRLIAITQAEEDRLQALRDDWDADVEAERQRKIAAERTRIEAIKGCIASIQNMPLQTVGKSSAEISAMIGFLAGSTIGEKFEEFADEAKAARLDSLDKMAKAETTQRAIETEAEAQRQQAAREKAERAEEAERLNVEREQLRRERAELADKLMEQERAQKAIQMEFDRKAKAEREQLEIERAALAAKIMAEESRQRAIQIDNERKAKLQAKISALSEIHYGCSEAEYKFHIATLQAVVIDAKWQEYAAEAESAKAASIAKHSELMDQRIAMDDAGSQLAEKMLIAEENAKLFLAQMDVERKATTDDAAGYHINRESKLESPPEIQRQSIIGPKISDDAKNLSDIGVDESPEECPDTIGLMVAALQNTWGYLNGVHNDSAGAQAHIERALTAAGMPFQPEGAA